MRRAPASRSACRRSLRCNAFRDPEHRRGNPPNVVETDPRTWLLLATGLLDVADAAASGALRLSGARAGEIADWLPLVRLPD